MQCYACITTVVYGIVYRVLNLDIERVKIALAVGRHSRSFEAIEARFSAAGQQQARRSCKLCSVQRDKGVVIFV